MKKLMVILMLLMLAFVNCSKTNYDLKIDNEIRLKLKGYKNIRYNEMSIYNQRVIVIHVNKE